MKALAGAAAALALLGVLPVLAQDTAAYRDRTRPVDERVRDLLARMTLDEKVAQTLALWKGKEKITDAQGQLDPAGARLLLANGLGQLSRPTELRDKPTRILLGPREDAVFVNAVQKWLVENTRLGIPVLTIELPIFCWGHAENARTNVLKAFGTWISHGASRGGDTQRLIHEVNQATGTAAMRLRASASGAGGSAIDRS